MPSRLFMFIFRHLTGTCLIHFIVLFLSSCEKNWSEWKSRTERRDGVWLVSGAKSKIFTETQIQSPVKTGSEPGEDFGKMRKERNWGKTWHILFGILFQGQTHKSQNMHVVLSEPINTLGVRCSQFSVYVNTSPSQNHTYTNMLTIFAWKCTDMKELVAHAINHAHRITEHTNIILTG